MKYILVSLVIAAGCADKAAPPATAPEHIYAVVDTIQSPGGDTRGVLKRDGIVIDTVDVAFGAPVVGSDSVLFLPVTSATDSSGGITYLPGAHVLFDGASRIPVASIVPDFDERFSAPSVIAGAFLYWGIHRGAAPAADSVRAVRYEFKRKRLNPLPVSPARLDTTRGRFYFTPPYLDGKEIVFKAPTGEWRFRTPKQ